MTYPVDATLIAALEAQHRQLTFVLGRLEAARAGLLPGHAHFWQGSARDTFNSGIDALRSTVDDGVAALRSARDRTAAAVAGMADSV